MKSVPSIRHPQVSVSVALLFVYLSLSVYLQTCIKISLPHTASNTAILHTASNTAYRTPHPILHTASPQYRIQYRIPDTIIPHNTAILQTAVFDMVRYGMRYGITVLQIAVIQQLRYTVAPLTVG